MRDNITAGLVALVLSLSLAAPVAAGPLEDGQAAYDRGDYTHAFRLWGPLADQGDAKAQSNLGYMYAKGQGVPQDSAEAVMWFRRAADQGDAEAQIQLGLMYENGQAAYDRGNYTQALRLWRPLADQGDAKAQFNLGYMYAKGQGVPQDSAEAIKWFHRAADQGDAEAQSNLGLMYASGHGVPRDSAKAAKWFRRAADQGYAKAQSILGLMYENGEGVPQDYVQAYKWLNLAASRLPASDAEKRGQAADTRDAVAAKMTPAQITEAQKMVREWKPTK